MFSGAGRAGALRKHIEFMFPVAQVPKANKITRANNRAVTRLFARFIIEARSRIWRMCIHSEKKSKWMCGFAWKIKGNSGRLLLGKFASNEISPPVFPHHLKFWLKYIAYAILVTNTTPVHDTAGCNFIIWKQEVEVGYAGSDCFIYVYFLSAFIANLMMASKCIL